MGIPMDHQAVISAINSWLVSTASRVRESIVMVSTDHGNTQCNEIHDSSRTATGFAVDRNVAVTVAHLEPGQSVCLVSASGERFSGRVLAIDRRWDLAFIESSKSLSPLRVSASIPPVGGLVVACGMPYGLLRPFFALGIVSGYKVNTVINGETVEGLMILSTPVMPGMSGGPVVDVHGDVVGMLVANAMASSEFALATPSRRIYYSYSILKKLGRVVHPRLGIKIIEGNHGGTEGVVVSSVYSDRISKICGIDLGDRLVSVNGYSIRSLEDLWDVLDEAVLQINKFIEIKFYDYSEKNVKECLYPLEV